MFDFIDLLVDVYKRIFNDKRKQRRKSKKRAKQLAKIRPEVMDLYEAYPDRFYHDHQIYVAFHEEMTTTAEVDAFIKFTKERLERL